MAEAEVWAESNPLWCVVAVGVAAATVGWSWRRQSENLPVRFDGSEPEIQMLNLN
jgi:hypothetical protein